MKNKIHILILCLIGIVFYVLTVRGTIGNFNTPDTYGKVSYATSPFESSHERASYMMMLAIGQDHRFDLTKEKADFGSPDVGFYKGKFYSFFPPGIPLLIEPLYNFGSHFNLGQVFSYFTICIFSLFAVIVVYKIAKEVFELSSGAAVFSAIIFAFGTVTWSYSISIYQHAITAFLALYSFYCVWRYKQGGRYSWIWASIVWICYGVSFAIDYPNAFILLPIMVYFLFSSFAVTEEDNRYTVRFNPAIVATFALFIVIIGVQLSYNKATFGEWKKFSNTLPRYSITNIAELQQQDTDAISKKKEQVANIFSETNLPRGFSELTVASDKGIFFFSPILLLALFGFYTQRRKLTGELVTICGFFVVNLLLYASFGDPWGGWAYGPRYLVPSMGFLAILCAIWVSRPSYQFIRKLAAFVLFAISSAIALLGALTTNVIPPKIEAIPLNMKYNYLYNIDVLKQGKLGSAFYNTHLAGAVTAETYYLILYIALLAIAAIILISMQSQKHHEH